MAGLLSPLRYAQVIYLTAPAARPVVTRAAGSLPPGDQARVVVRDLPAVRVHPGGGRGDRVGLAEVHRLPVAAPQGLQAGRVAAAGRGRCSRPGRSPLPAAAGYAGGVAAGLAAGPAVPDRRLDAAGHRRVAGRRGGPARPGWRPAPRRPAGPGRAAGPTWPPGPWPACSLRWPRSRSRPGWRWAGCCGRGGSTPSPPGWAASWRRPRSPSTPGSGGGRSAPPRA